MLSVMSVPFSLKTVGNLFCLILCKNYFINCFPSISYVISEMMKTCFIVYLFCGVNILLQNQIIWFLLCHN